MSKKIELKAWAKINIFLEVLNKRNDGYHNISSVMQTVSLCDELEISVLDKSEIELIIENNNSLSTEENIVIKASKFFFEHAKIKDKGVRINLVKNIPVLAGLGGGSADAAAVLRGLNELFNKPFSFEELEKIGAKIGADVPFCVRGGTCYVSGIGEKILTIKNMPECYIAIAKHGKKLSTKYAYETLDTMQNRLVVSSGSILKAIDDGDLVEMSECMYNSFSLVFPEDEKVKSEFMKYNPLGIVLSGSGPSVIAVFDDKTKAENAVKALIQQGIEAYVTVPIYAY